MSRQLEPAPAVPSAQHVAVVEPAELWRGWLLKTIPPSAEVQVHGSAQSLLTALQTKTHHMLVVGFRLPDLDGYSWIKLLRNSSGGRDAKILACIGEGDSRGESLALLAGADAVHRKVVGAPAMTEWLHRHLAAPACAEQPGLSRCDVHQLPLYESGLTPATMPGARVAAQVATLDFLCKAMAQIESLQVIYGRPGARTFDRLDSFARAAEVAGAWRVAAYTQRMLAQLRSGGLLQPALRPEYASLMLTTVREVAISLLERRSEAW